MMSELAPDEEWAGREPGTASEAMDYNGILTAGTSSTREPVGATGCVIVCRGHRPRGWLTRMAWRATPKHAACPVCLSRAAIRTPDMAS